MKVLCLLSLLLFVSGTCHAQPKSIFEHGMWLCKNPLSAASIQNSMLNTKTAGVNITRDIADQLVKKEISGYGDPAICERVDSDNLKPIWNSLYDNAAYPNQWIFVADEKLKKAGWVGTYSYAIYMRYHSVSATPQ